jgi:hypothetical protein
VALGTISQEWIKMTGIMPDDTFSIWREEGSRLIQQHHQEFSRLVTQAKDFTILGKYDLAAVYGEMAALYAACQHCGFFVNTELEEILLSIGRKAISTNTNLKRSQPLQETPKYILHVASSVQSIGGLSRMIWRWIQQDSDRSHSLVLTRQPGGKDVPKILRDSVINSGGKIYKLNETIGSLIAWARRLREIAAVADLVILHVYNHDVIPIIAFANKEEHPSPPIILLNHADHLFWLGKSISDIVANLRESGRCLSMERRGIEVDRNLLLPIIIEPTQRSLPRSEAKKKLGLPEDSIVLLSIARALKYRTINATTFADIHVPLLIQYPNTVLVVIGPDSRENWADAIYKTGGRVIVYPERDDTAIFHQAADIYVDSFPINSTTSMLEAGSYGVPLVSLYPYSDASKILGADMPGLTKSLIYVHNLRDYTAVLSRLVEDEKHRLSLGEATSKEIAEVHWGENWQCSLNELYERAITTPRLTSITESTDQMFFGEPDVYLPILNKYDFDMDSLMQAHLSIMPLEQKLSYSIKYMIKSGSRLSFKQLLPEWLSVRLLKLLMK